MRCLFFRVLYTLLLLFLDVVIKMYTLALDSSISSLSALSPVSPTLQHTSRDATVMSGQCERAELARQSLRGIKSREAT